MSTTAPESVATMAAPTVSSPIAETMTTTASHGPMMSENVGPISIDPSTNGNFGTLPWLLGGSMSVPAAPTTTSLSEVNAV